MIAPITQAQLDDCMNQHLAITLNLLKLPTQHYEMRATFIYAVGKETHLKWEMGQMVQIPGSSEQGKLQYLNAIGIEMAKRHTVVAGIILGFQVILNGAEGILVAGESINNLISGYHFEVHRDNNKCLTPILARASWRLEDMRNPYTSAFLAHYVIASRQMMARMN